MKRWTTVRTIHAAPERVFRTVADPEEFQKAIPGGSGVEYLTAERSGAGMRFRSTRVTRGKPMSFEQEVTEFVPGERIRMVNVTHGTLWDSTFHVRPHGDDSVLTLTMDATARKLMGRVVNHLIGGMVQKALEHDMDAVKAYCER